MEPRRHSDSKLQKAKDFLAKQVAKLNSRGHEIPDDTEVAIPLGFKRPETLSEQVARLVRSERFQQQAEEQGYDTFEDFDDFDVDDEFDSMPHSAYEFEENFEPKVTIPPKSKPSREAAKEPEADSDPKQKTGSKSEAKPKKATQTDPDI